jgi:acyl carrier protein
MCSDNHAITGKSMPEITDQDIIKAVEIALGTSLNGWTLDMCSPVRLPRWDSLAHLNLIGLLEEQYAVFFEPEELERSLEGAAAIKTLVNAKLGGKKA